MAEKPPAIWLETEALVPWADNPRLKDEDHIASIVRSIKATAEAVARARGDEYEPEGADLEIGFGAPIVARAENREIIAGHTRLYAAERLGMPRVPVRFLDLPEDAAHRLARADNRGTESGAWDVSRLAAQLKADADRDIALVEDQGWTRGQLDALIESTRVHLPAGEPQDRSFQANANALVEIEVPRDRLPEVIERIRELAKEVGATVSIA